MKTSIKMLLVFVGTVLLLVLASDVVLWAYFKKGINGDGTVLRYPKNGDNERKEKMIDLHPFKAIVIKTDQVRIMYDTENRIGILGAHTAPSDLYKQVGDTLYILKSGDEDIYTTVHCKSVEYIKLAKDSLNVDIMTLKQPALEVDALNDCAVNLTGVEVEKLTYRGGKGNKITTHELGKYETMNFELGWYGSVDLQDVTVKNFNIKADSMQALRLDEMVQSQLLQFKRN